jgi:hypothetical protein
MPTKTEPLLHAIPIAGVQDTPKLVRERRALMRGLRKYGVCLACAKVIYDAACHNLDKANWRGTGFRLEKECSEAFLLFLRDTPVHSNRYVDAVRVIQPRNKSARMIAEKI